MLDCEFPHAVYDDSQFWEKYFQSIPEDNEIGVVGDVTRGGPQVNDGHGRWASSSKRVHVSHHVMSKVKCHRLIIFTMVSMG